ncbi:MAG: hypothetical protein KatS3mg068_1063 [Candidatus Sericytochromatia bacterium]|nr:MAG: hypothetical protein KatS3mg068_1063 [Candidatus Sericytochromatia bacterium]
MKVFDIQQLIQNINENKPFIIKVNYEDIINLINWNKFNEIINNSELDKNNIVTYYKGMVKNIENEVLNHPLFIEILNQNSNLTIKKINFLDKELLDLCFELSNLMNSYIEMDLEVENGQNHGKEIHREIFDSLVIQVYGDSYWEIFDKPSNNKLGLQTFENSVFSSTLNEGQLIYIPNYNFVRKKTSKVSMYLYMNIYRFGTMSYLNWIKNNILFSYDFIIEPKFQKDTFNNFINKFKDDLIEIINFTNKDYLYKQKMLIKNKQEILLPNLFKNW